MEKSGLILALHAKSDSLWRKPRKPARFSIRLCSGDSNMKTNRKKLFCSYLVQICRKRAPVAPFLVEICCSNRSLTGL